MGKVMQRKSHLLFIQPPLCRLAPCCKNRRCAGTVFSFRGAFACCCFRSLLRMDVWPAMVLSHRVYCADSGFEFVPGMQLTRLPEKRHRLPICTVHLFPRLCIVWCDGQALSSLLLHVQLVSFLFCFSSLALRLGIFAFFALLGLHLCQCSIY